jgi:hypothetical protein
VNIFLTAVVSLATCEDNLKGEATVWDRCDCNDKAVYVLSVIILVSIGELFSNPAFEVRYVARQIH